MSRQRITISITQDDFVLWSKHATACDDHLSGWISRMIHMGLQKKLDDPLLKRDPNRVSVTAAVVPPPPVETRGRPRRPVELPPSAPVPSPDDLINIDDEGRPTLFYTGKTKRRGDL